jgi:hypothetical protein
MLYGAYQYTYKYIEYYQDIENKEVSNQQFADKHIYKDYHYFFKHHTAAEKNPNNNWLDTCLQWYRKHKYEIEI